MIHEQTHALNHATQHLAEVMMNRSVRAALPGKNVTDVLMPKVTFIKDGKETTVEFEHGKMPFDGHGLPESFLDLAMNNGIHARARVRRQLCLHDLPSVSSSRASRT